MARGIILFGPAGSGKTTLGRQVALSLGCPYLDIDDYIWRADIDPPFTVMYRREEKIARLTAALANADRFVMGGSMDSFHEAFDGMFDLGVHLTAPVALRQERLHARELARFGARVLPGGDMAEAHQRFLEMAARYDTDGSPSYRVHAAWAASLPCPVLRLSGATALEANAEAIVAAYRQAVQRKE